MEDKHKKYFEYLSSRTMLGRVYKNFILYPLLSKHLYGKILDVGCGIGDALLSFKNIIGVDVNPYSIDFCKSRGVEAKLINGNLLPFDNNSFDSVLMDNVLEHLEEPIPLINEIRRVMVGNGLLVVGVPGLKGWHSDSDHKTFYDYELLVAKFESNGFDHVKTFFTPLGKSEFLNKRLSQYCIYSTFRPIANHVS